MFNFNDVTVCSLQRKHVDFVQLEKFRHKNEEENGGDGHQETKSKTRIVIFSVVLEVSKKDPDEPDSHREDTSQSYADDVLSGADARFPA